MFEEKISAALEAYEKLLREQLQRNEEIKETKDFVDYSSLEKIIIGVCGGDGIGPVITAESARVLEFLLANEIKSGKIEIRNIEGLTIENRIAKMHYTRL